MKPGRPDGRISLRQRLIQAEDCSRQAIEQLRQDLLPCLSELRQLSRSVRHHSAYPTAATLLAALQRLLEADQQARKLADSLCQQLGDLHEAYRQQRRPRRRS
jgi:hypothetical protein